MVLDVLDVIEMVILHEWKSDSDVSIRVVMLQSWP